MSKPMNAPPPAPAGPVPLPAVLVLAAAVAACTAYANLSFAVTDPADYRYFPPFEPRHNEHRTAELGGENFEMSRSLVAGQGFANPFKETTGPTAWMPPLLPLLQAGLLWACDSNRNAVMAVVIALQGGALVVTGCLVLVLVGQTSARPRYALATALLVLGLLGHFLWWFQRTHDYFLVVLALDGLIAGACWLRPFGRYRTAAAWGLFGGLSALVSPVLGLCWGALSVAVAGRSRAWRPLAVAVSVGALALAPWTVRNWLVFGRLIPVKSNLAYELYQSQCLQKDGLIQRTTFASHPYQSANRERREYRALGETAFLDLKRQQFRRAVATDPLDFARRVGDRLLGATLWYVPYDRSDETKWPWLMWSKRLLHPLPFLALLLLALTSSRRPLRPAQAAVMAVYLLYLLPYVVVSYYERYAVPLLGIKVLLVVWGADRLLAPRPGGRSV
jgi:hypothetical protein